MSKISISKKTAWSLILKINSKISCKNNLVNINEDIRGQEINITYNKSNDHIENSNLSDDHEINDLLKIFLPIVCSSKKTQFIAHIAQSLDGFIATNSGESKYISSKENLEHIHRLRAISDIIIVGANTFREDKPKLTTRLVEGENPKIYVFDPKRILKSNQISNNIKIISDKDVMRSKFSKYKTIYIEGGGKTISYFMEKNILDRIHVCLCPVILGGGRSSFIQNKNISINNLKSYDPKHYNMGNDVLFDLKV